MGITAALQKATRKPIESCYASMGKSEGELAKLTISTSHLQRAPTKRQKVEQALKWATGAEERVRKLVADLSTEKATWVLALMANLSYAITDR